MITDANVEVACPACTQALTLRSGFRLFGRADANVYFCKKCETFVLSWRLFIKRRDNSPENPIIIPTNEKVHRYFIAHAREVDDMGPPKFNEERLLVLTDRQFREYKERFESLHVPDIALVIGAYREHVGLSPALN